MKRREFITASSVTAIAGLSAACSKTSASGNTTPPEAEGPFYPVIAQKDKDFDLTKIGNDSEAEGEKIFIKGRVLDQDGNPVESAIVDLWQANTHGRYAHPVDSNPAPLDPNFQGWAIVESGTDGSFNFKTIIPGAYPANKDWTRPPHIHFKVSKRGYVDLTTQMYFPGHVLNDIDKLMLRQPEQARSLMVSKKHDALVDGLSVYQYDIILEKA